MNVEEIIACSFIWISFFIFDSGFEMYSISNPMYALNNRVFVFMTIIVKKTAYFDKQY